MTIIVNSYFSGAGLMDLGLLDAGLEIGKAYELDSDACKTYRYNIGNHIKQSDLTEELVLEQEDCDVMVFTYPCNKYSAIADLFSQRTGDDLFLHSLRHIALKQPEMYVVENVVGMKAFPIVMECLTKLPDYYIQCFCPVKSCLWVPQRRDRLIIIASKKPFEIRPPENTRPISLAEILEDDPEVNWPKSIETRMNGGYRDKPIISDPSKGDIAPTAVAHYAKDKSTRLVVDKRFKMGVRPYSLREWARLQGLPDTFLFPVSSTAAFKQIGNGVTFQVARWVGTEIKRYFNK